MKIYSKTRTFFLVLATILGSLTLNACFFGVTMLFFSAEPADTQDGDLTQLTIDAIGQGNAQGGEAELLDPPTATADELAALAAAAIGQSSGASTNTTPDTSASKPDFSANYQASQQSSSAAEPAQSALSEEDTSQATYTPNQNTQSITIEVSVEDLEPLEDIISGIEDQTLEIDRYGNLVDDSALSVYYDDDIFSDIYFDSNDVNFSREGRYTALFGLEVNGDALTDYVQANGISIDFDSDVGAILVEIIVTVVHIDDGGETIQQTEPSTPNDSGSNISGGNSNSQNTVDTDAFAMEVLELVNAERESYGLDPLSYDAALYSASDVRAVELESYYSHTRPDGSSCFTAITTDYGYAGENIAEGYTTPAAVMNGWMNSQGHRENILSSNFTHLGVGVHQYANGRIGWVQLFISSP